MTLHCSSWIYFQCGFQIQYGKMLKATHLLSSFIFLLYETMHTPCCDTKLEIRVSVHCWVISFLSCWLSSVLLYCSLSRKNGAPCSITPSSWPSDLATLLEMIKEGAKFHCYSQAYSGKARFVSLGKLLFTSVLPSFPPRICSKQES